MIARLPLTAGLLLGVIVLASVIALVGAGQEWLVNVLHELEAGARAHYFRGLFIFVTAFALLAMLTLPVATLFCLAGGYLFGALIGSAASLAGACCAAALTFLLARYAGGRTVRMRLAAGRADTWLTALERDATWYLILLRIVPVAPFFAINAAAGVTGVGFGHFLLTTTIGLIPITIIYASVGASLNSILDARDMLGPALLLQPQIGLPLAALATIIITSWIIRRRLHPH